MRILYLDCGMGAAGDMLAAALIELLPDPQRAVDELNRLGLPGVCFWTERAQRCGIAGTRMRVMVDGHEEGEYSHAHIGLREVETVLAHTAVSGNVCREVLAVYGRLAQAESRVHGVTVEQVHFHEVGMLDAIADITAVCWLMERLGVDAVYASPVHVGCGQVRCAHGILPVPAPATAELLRGVPIYGGGIEGELCTPTGAALLVHFVSAFGRMPPMTLQATGYGMGKKDFAAANCLRVMLGETADCADTVVELCCNLDDMTGEEIGFAMEQLLQAGALDVFTTPVGMKKNRPGILLTVLCREQDRAAMAREIFCQTTTLGVRVTLCSRYVLERSVETVQTPYGPVRKKTASGYGVTRSKPEYDDLARIAREKGWNLRQVRERLQLD